MIKVISVNVYPNGVTITKGKWYYGAYAVVNASSDCYKDVEWYSDNSAIASVNKTTGYIYGVNPGTTRIYARSIFDGSKIDHITVTVAPPVSVTGVSVCPTSKTMDVGCTDYLYATIYPSNATNQTVTWCSSDDSVAEVNTYSGKVTAKNVGVATITACTVDGGYSASCVVTVNYCGGSNYRDVTKHNMVLQNDGYYVCSKCGYRIKSPELEDKDVLSFDDYIKVVSCQMCYSYLETLFASGGDEDSTRDRQEILYQMITEIRQQSEYNHKYSYCDSNGKCVGPEITYNAVLSAVGINEVDILNITKYNGFDSALHDLIVGYYCPTISLAQSIIDIITHQMNAIEFSALVLDEFGYEKISLGLSIASATVDALNSEVQLTDRVVIVVVKSVKAYCIFSHDGKFKRVIYEFGGI